MLVKIEGVWFNPGNVVMVRAADRPAGLHEGQEDRALFKTEVVCTNQIQLLQAAPDDVAHLLNQGTPDP